MKIIMTVVALVIGAVTSVADISLSGKKNAKGIVYTVLRDVLICGLTAFGLTGLFVENVQFVRDVVIYAATAAVTGIVFLFAAGVADGNITFTKTEKTKRSHMAISIVALVFFVLGIAAFTGTVWGKTTFGDIAPDQMIVNLFSPTEGTSDEVMDTFWMQPFFRTVFAGTVFGLFAFSKRTVILKHKDKEHVVFCQTARKIIALVLACATLTGGIIYGVKKFQLNNLYKMYVMKSSFIEDNYADPDTVKLEFPEKKRNLIHIYLESMENSYTDKANGGYMDENLIKPLTDLAKEGVSFSHLEKGFGGAVTATGCNWSVASMVNMNTGLPMKVPTRGNHYGSPDSFLPGATMLGDILHEQGYEQTLLLGSTAKFGGLSYMYTAHGNFNILDYDKVKENGWIPNDYKVWWGFEDDKLYEYAKAEITRLYETGKPFNFVMETADTHFPDGYVSPNTPLTRPSQYANVIAFSASETVKFVRWIQEQPFYENTTIVLIGDHNSMDYKFFADFDRDYLRTTFNLILNPADTVSGMPEEYTHNRWFANFDMYPTLLASIGVKIEGDKLGIGTNLFSGKKTLFEEYGGGSEGVEYVNGELGIGSPYYNNHILKDDGTHFKDKNNMSVYVN